MARRARRGSPVRASATSFVAASPMPIPATAMNVLVVLCTMPELAQALDPSRWPAPTAPARVSRARPRPRPATRTPP